jgi:hypothetical protein
MIRLFKLGGYFASGILIALGAGIIVVGAIGFSEVRDTIAQEHHHGNPGREGAGSEPGPRSGRRHMG